MESDGASHREKCEACNRRTRSKWSEIPGERFFGEIPPPMVAPIREKKMVLTTQHPPSTIVSFLFFSLLLKNTKKKKKRRRRRRRRRKKRRNFIWRILQRFLKFVAIFFYCV